MFLDALFVQFPCVYELQCWVSDLQDPSLQTPASCSLSIEEADTDCSAPSPSTCAASARSASRDRCTGAGTAGDPGGNVPEEPSDIPPCLRPSKQKNGAHLVENTSQVPTPAHTGTPPFPLHAGGAARDARRQFAPPSLHLAHTL